MQPALLYAVEDAGPRALHAAPHASGFDGLYAGLALGVYEAFRTFGHNRFLDLEEHLERTRRSMLRLGWGYRLDGARMRRCLHRVCTDAPFEEMRVRFDVLGAPASALGSPARELIALVPFTPPPRSVYDQGVAVATTDAIARDDPLAKTAEFVERRRSIERAAPQVYEHLLVNAAGEILEGFSSNFYAVCAGVLVTAGEGVLEGVTRRIVLQLARDRDVPVRLEPTRREQLAKLEEAAISSSSRGLVPVVRIDGQPVGGGHPGPLVTSLSADYEAFVAARVRPAA